MGLQNDIPSVRKGDWNRLKVTIDKLRHLALGNDSHPKYAGLTLSGLTASTLIGANASKALESVTVGTGLDYTRPNLTLSHLGIEALTDPGADRILFWDESAPNACKWLGVGNSIAITATTLDTIQDIRTTASPTFAGLTVSGTSTPSITIQSTDASDPTIIFKTTNTAHQIEFYLDENVVNDVLWLKGRTEGVDTRLDIEAIDGEIAALRLRSGLTNYGTIYYSATNILNMRNNLQDGDLLFGIDDGGVLKTIIWDADVDKLKHSAGTFDFDNDHLTTTGNLTAANCSLETGELTCGSINRATGTLTLEIGGTAEISITTTTVTLGGNLIIPDNGTIGSASDTDVMTIDASGNTTFSVFPITPSAAPDADYEVANKKYVDDNVGGVTTWLALTDTDPVNYTGEAGNCVVVNAGEDGLEFGAAPGGGFTSRASVWLGSSQSIPKTSWTQIQLDTENWDGDGEFASYVFTATAAGYYHVTGRLTALSMAAGKLLYVSIRKNGVNFSTHATYSTTAGTNRLEVSCDVYLDGDTDYIDLAVYHTDTVNRSLSGAIADTNICIHRFA